MASSAVAHEKMIIQYIQLMVIFGLDNYIMVTFSGLDIM